MSGFYAKKLGEKKAGSGLGGSGTASHDTLNLAKQQVGGFSKRKHFARLRGGKLKEPAEIVAAF